MEDVFVITFDRSRHSFVQPFLTEHDTRPSIKSDAAVVRLRDYASHVPRRGDWRSYPFTGLQITRTALWLVWDVNLLTKMIKQRKQGTTGTLADVEEDVGERRCLP